MARTGKTVLLQTYPCLVRGEIQGRSHQPSAFPGGARGWNSIHIRHPKPRDLDQRDEPQK